MSLERERAEKKNNSRRCHKIYLKNKIAER